MIDEIEFVLAGSRCNGREATARLSNQQAGSPFDYAQGRLCAPQIRDPVPIETRSLPALARSYPRHFTLITRTARARASYPSCVSVYPRD